MKKRSRILSILLAIMLVVPMFSFAEPVELEVKTEDQIQLESKIRTESEKQKENDITGILKALEEDNLENQEEVRVIVELKKKALVEVANDSELIFGNLSRKSIKTTEKLIDVEKKSVKKAIKSQSIDMNFVEDYNTLLNGFSGDVKAKDLEKLSSLPQVKKVYLANTYKRPEIETKMVNTAELIENLGDQLGHKKYNGEGMVVAVIDSGIDPYHKDFKLSDEDKVKLSKEDVKALGLVGKYFSPKIPYAYNYIDRNDNVRDTAGVDASMHGQHVSGTVAANGEDGKGIKGVAPEAQILGMKVFSNDPNLSITTDDAIIRALEDSITLGADVINMSLGTTAGYSIPDDAVDACIERAADNGVIVCVSAGNESHNNYGYFNETPLKSNPDFGVVGTPGRSENSLQVASMENRASQERVIYVNVDGEKSQFKANYSKSAKNDRLFEKEYWTEIVDCEFGQIELMDDVEGKIVLVQRGGEDPYANFGAKVKNAQDKGAAGVIVYNHEEGFKANIQMDFSDYDINIPALFTSYDAGLLIKENISNVKIRFPEGMENVNNKEFGKMSEFSSWGPGPDLELKPEITGPGGRIYSTLNDDKYGMMDGTSMSAPHLSGISALVKQHINEDDRYKGLSEFEKVRLAKTLIMNTAKIIREGGIDLNLGEEVEISTPVSPRKQGAGLAQVYSAVSTPVTIVDTATKQAKTELKEIKDKKFTMSYRASNHTDKDVIYNLEAIALRDEIEERSYKVKIEEDIHEFTDEYITLNPKYLTIEESFGGNATKSGILVVPANSEREFTVTIDFSKDRAIYENMFIDGFVLLKDEEDIHPELSIPFMGFYGDWSYGDAIDGIFGFGEDSFYKNSGFVGKGFIGNIMYQELITMNPGVDNGDAMGTARVTPVLSTLRNTEEIRFSILDKSGKKIWNVGNVYNRRKSFSNGGRSNPFSEYDEGTWDGRIKGKLVEDGKYFYQVESKVAHKNAKFKTRKYPILIDRTPPKLSDVEFDFDTNTLSFTAVDEGVGFGHNTFMIQLNRKYIDSKEVEKLNESVEEGKTRFECKINEVEDLVGDTMNIRIFVDDKINNRVIEEFEFKVKNSGAYIYLDTPLPIHYGPESLKHILNDDGFVEIEGYVANYEDLKELRIYDEMEENPEIIKADLEFEEYVVIKHILDSDKIIYSGPAYKFTSKMKFDEGHHNLRFEAVSKSGHKDSIVRDFVFDTTAPEIKVKNTEYNKSDNELKVDLSLYDNLNNYNLLKLKRNNMEVFKKSSNNTFGKRIEGMEVDFTEIIDLDEIYEDEIRYTLKDSAGNESGITISIGELGNVDIVDRDIYKIHNLSIIPIGSKIVGDKAYSESYINANQEIQKLIKNTLESGEEVITKEDSSTYRSSTGVEKFFLYLPATIYVYDLDQPVLMCTPFY